LSDFTARNGVITGQLGECSRDSFGDDGRDRALGAVGF